jgi:hypothetical protein
MQTQSEQSSQPKDTTQAPSAPTSTSGSPSSPRKPRKAKAQKVQLTYLGSPVVQDNQSWHNLTVQMREISAECAEILMCAAGKCQRIGTVCDTAGGASQSVNDGTTRIDSGS